MELLLKSAGAALLAALIGLLLKKINPEISLLLGITVTAVIIIASAGFISVLFDLTDAVRKYAGASETVIVPVMKCLAISLTTKIASELCKDASQASLSSAVELAGNICALSVAAPLLLSMLSMLSEIV